MKFELTMLGMIPLFAAAIAAVLIIVSLPLFRFYALSRPNSRSSHREPTPQGGGAAVVVATLLTASLAAMFAGSLSSGWLTQFLTLIIATVVLSLTGLLDDIRGLDAWPRLAVQSIVVAFVVGMLPNDLRVSPTLPLWLERAGLLLAGVWVVNLVNFMDGIDWMTVAEAAPVTATLALLGLFGFLAELPMLIALALLGAIVGFAPFNRPVAKLFLGDVGSLPIGLLLFWLLLQLAASGHLAAAFLLFLYYFADATVTLLRRIAALEAIWQSHRTHFYQIATKRGFTVPDVVLRVLLVNIALAALAIATVVVPGSSVTIACLAAGTALVAWTLVRFSRGPRS